MPRAARATLSVLIAATAALGIGACAEDRSNLLPSDAARQITVSLDEVQVLADQGECFEALETAEEARQQVEALGLDVDRQLKRSLLDGVTQLQIKVQDDCEDSGTAVEEPIEEPEPGPTGDTGVVIPDDDDDDDDGDDNGDDGDDGDNGNGGNRPANPGQGNPDPNPTPPQQQPPNPGSGGVGPGS